MCLKRRFSCLPVSRWIFRCNRCARQTSSGIICSNGLFFIDDRLQEGQNRVYVRELSSTVAPEKLRILSYSVKAVAQGERYQSEILLANDLNDPLFLRIEGFAFYIYRDRSELYRYQAERALNALVPAHSTRTIFRSEEWRELRFDRPGTYLIRAVLNTNQGEKVFEEEIFVLEKPVRTP